MGFEIRFFPATELGKGATHRALGLPLYMPSPLHVSPEHPCPWPNGSGGATSWPLALELRTELIKAAGEDEQELEE